MRKKVIGIDLNEVIRSHYSSVEEFYRTEFKGEKEFKPGYGVNKPFKSYEYLDNFIFTPKKVETKYLKKDAPEDLPDNMYIVNKKGVAKADSLLFETVIEDKSAIQQLEEFLYEDYIYDTFGACGKTYPSVINDIHQLYGMNRDEFDFVIVSLENVKSVSMSLHFLGKTGIKLPKYIFADECEKIWKEIDILITANPTLIKAKPKNKSVIKLEAEWNSDVKTDFSITKIGDLKEQDLKLRYNNSILKLIVKYVRHKIKLPS